MAGEGEYKGVEKGAELGAEEDVKLEQLVIKLENTTNLLAVAITSASNWLKKKRQHNPAFQLSAKQHYQTGKGCIKDMLELRTVRYSLESATVVATGIERFLSMCERGDWLPHRAELPQMFQPLADKYFSEDTIDKLGRPCEVYKKILRTYAKIPEIEQRVPVGQGQSPPLQREPEILYQKAFQYGNPQNPHQKHLGELYLNYLIHRNGIPKDVAEKKVNAQALMGFDQSLVKQLGNYRGLIQFFIVQEPSGEVKVKLLRTRYSS
ncbi:hypothetical protein HYS48_01805 [Candidatus Woesearchaeota archaeon]|nr:hypothetical protein [Candidatus Woesearchaeota archaeon]